VPGVGGRVVGGGVGVMDGSFFSDPWIMTG